MDTSSRRLHDLLRDTALTVTTLATGGRPASVESLRENGTRLANEMNTAMAERGFSHEEREEAVFAQCALFDETALRSLEGDDRAAWQAHPLQAARFERLDGGKQVFVNLEEHMASEKSGSSWLVFYAGILALGFRGHHARGGETALRDLRARLNARIGDGNERPLPDFIVEYGKPGAWRRLRPYLPWLAAGASWVAAVATYVVCSRALDAELARWFPLAG
ncbi:DotU/TssL family secretion system protein [Luteibacter sp.]|jgi:type VI secretion system protein ImpK|uniref:DotU/TssL family secretion system protein n=1 Tax=Luteibacter sp. TaxID=1886636 RepID=UPI002F3E7621